MKKVISMVVIVVMLMSCICVSQVQAAEVCKASVTNKIVGRMGDSDWNDNCVFKTKQVQVVSWSSISNCSKYYLFLGTIPQGSSTPRWRVFKYLTSNDVVRSGSTNMYTISKDTLHTHWSKYGVDKAISTPYLESGTRYCYQVKYLLNNGNYRWSNVTSYTYLPPAEPDWVSMKPRSGGGYKAEIIYNSWEGGNMLQYQVRFKDGTTTKTENRTKSISKSESSQLRYMSSGQFTLDYIFNVDRVPRSIDCRMRMLYKTQSNGTAYGDWSPWVGMTPQF